MLAVGPATMLLRSRNADSFEYGGQENEDSMGGAQGLLAAWTGARRARAGLAVALAGLARIGRGIGDAAARLASGIGDWGLAYSDRRA